MYCPTCLNNTIAIREEGVIDLIINGKRMDSGRFYFNLGKEKEDEIIDNLKKKFEAFFQWYSNFQNIEPIQSIRLITSNAFCRNKCKFDPNMKFSIVNIIIPAGKVKKLAYEMGHKYKIKIDLKEI